jgi:IPT/TIG domain
MRSCLHIRKPVPWLRIALVAILPLILCAGTCTAIFGFNSCLGIPPAPQITSLSPNPISANSQSVLLTVIGNNFASQSQILWNRNALQTAFVDSQHLQATITQQTFEQFGGSAGSSVLISVNSVVTSTVVGCPIGGSSATLVLIIN